VPTHASGVDNADVNAARFPELIFVAAVIASFSTLPVGARAASPDALSHTLRGTHAAAVVLDFRTGSLLASTGTAPSSTPGSTLKPILLQYALDHGVVRADTQVYCRRSLHIGGRALPCTHPADQPVFNAENALAESCNTWFAEMARRLTGQQLDDALVEAKLHHARFEGSGIEDRQLATLGLKGVTATPLELARAYAGLLAHLSLDSTVARGLLDSVAVGMASPAAVNGVSILGKTGTASNPGETWTHGWFVGAIPGRVVIAIYVPHGDGGTAARLAHTYFSKLVAAERER
jgi:peptidoglycan glycosyltransferase